MPIYMEILPLHRLVTIVARGTVSTDDVRGTAQKLADARVRRFAKIVEVASARFDFQPADIMALAQVLRADADGRGPIDLFKSIHDARAWIATIQHAAKPVPVTAWADPDRQGTVIRGMRTHEFTTRGLVH